MPGFLKNPLCMLVAVSAVIAVSGHGWAREIPQEVREICREDFLRHCPGVTPDGGRAVDCMMRNYERLSQQCVNAVMRHERDRHGNDWNGIDPSWR